MIGIKNIFVFILLLLSFRAGYSQVSSNELKAALVLQICENIKWPENDGKKFTIGFLDKKDPIYKLLKESEGSVKIQKKELLISFAPNIEDFTTCKAVFYTPRSGEPNSTILNWARENNILLITDNYKDELFVFANLIEHDSKVTFNINMTNLALAGLEATPNLLLNAGNVVDIKAAYEDFESKLANINRKYDEVFTELNNKVAELENKETELEKKDSELVNKDSLLLQKEESLTHLNEKLKINTSELYKLSARTRSYEKQLKQKTTLLENKEDSLAKIQLAIYKSEEELNELKSISNDLQKEITDKNKLVTTQQEHIENQKKLLYFSLISLGALVFGVFSLLALFISRKRNASKLQIINKKLIDKNNIINKQNKELKATLQNLKAAQVQLIQAEKMASLGILTAGVAHEINNPLNFILGAHEGLKKHFKNSQEEPVKKLLDILQIGVERASKIVKGLNQFSRNSKSFDEICSIHTILNNCLTILQHQLKDRIIVHKNFQNSDISVKGNSGDLHQVFINIIGNAAQSIPNKGTISIETKANPRHAEIIIQDNGVGISEENLKRIKDPFFTTKNPGEGTGLGLSITHNIVKEHCGKLVFISKLGEGTTVKVRIPYKTKNLNKQTHERTA